MIDSDVTAIVTCHDENPYWIRRAILSVINQKKCSVKKTIIFGDKCTNKLQNEILDIIRELANGSILQYANRDFGDLGESRNHCVKMATTKYVAFLDGDDVWGDLWISQALAVAEKMKDGDMFCVHNQLSLFFGRMFGQGQNPYFQFHVGSDSPEFDARQLIQFNPWSALAFVPREIALRFPYFRADKYYGYEDYEWAVRTLDAGVKHLVAPGSLHAVRLKADATSMATRNVSNGLVIPRSNLFERRDLPKPIDDPEKTKSMALDIEHISQIENINNDIGEYQVTIHPQSVIRKYPKAKSYDSFVRLRDFIGSSKNVVLIQDLIHGGAESYALDWASALGKDTAIIATGFSGSTREDYVKSKGMKFFEWKNDDEINEQELGMALQRALIQSDLDSVMIANSSLGLALMHENAACLAKKVFVASFATIPAMFSRYVDNFPKFLYSCPLFWMKKLPQNVYVVTDNEVHKSKLIDFDKFNVSVIYPKCKYSGPTKRSKIEKKRYRVLWAGRGSFDKCPDLLPAIAKCVEDEADIHVWGNVQALNGPENLKYRGPFDGFDKIDGSYDCLLMTSLNEGMPNIALEATMADLPVVSPDVGGLRVIADKKFSSYAPESIASALMSVLKEPVDRKQLAHKKVMISNWRDGFDYLVRELVNEGKIEDGKHATDAQDKVESDAG